MDALITNIAPLGQDTRIGRGPNVRAELIRLIYTQSRVGVIASWISAIILVIVLWNVVPQERLLVWLFFYSLAQAPRQYEIRKFFKSEIPNSSMENWGRRFTVYAVISGALWGLGGAFLFPPDSLQHQFLIAVFLSGISAAAVVVYSPLLECYLPTLMAALVPFAIRFMMEGWPLGATIGLVILLYAIVLGLAGARMYNITVQSVALRYDKEDLIESLTREKRAGERINEELRREIDRRAEAERALRNSEQTHRLLVDNANEAIVVIQDNRFRFANTRALEMSGYSMDDFLGKEMSELLCPDDRERVVDYHKRRILNEQAPYIYECRMKTSGGDYKWVESKVAMTQWEGRPAALGFVSDLTERKEFEEKILASLEEKELLLREVHHRVKNNLQVIISLLRLQSRQVSDPILKSLLEDSQNRVQSMAFLHEKLYQSENLAKVDFPDYLHKLLGLLKGSYGPARGKVTVVTDIDVTSLDIDMATHLGMISGELISNCLKHAFPDGEDGTIMVNVSRARLGMIQLMVQDNGIGLPHGFDLEEVDSVGLRLVKAIVRQMSGTFELNPGESGAGFRIVLPTNGAGH